MRGLTQKEVAAALGCDLKTVSRWELNKSKPDAHNVKRLMVLFQKSAIELGLFVEDVPTGVRTSLVAPSTPERSAVDTMIYAVGKLYLLLMRDRSVSMYCVSRVRIVCQSLLRNIFMVVKQSLH